MKSKKVVEEYLKVFFGSKLNPESLRFLITEDFYFKGPMMTASNAGEFIAKLKGFNSEIIMNAKIHQIIGEGKTIVARYDFLLPNGISIPASEWYEIEDGKISNMLLFCDPKPFFI